MIKKNLQISHRIVVGFAMVSLCLSSYGLLAQEEDLNGSPSELGLPEDFPPVEVPQDMIEDNMDPPGLPPEGDEPDMPVLPQEDSLGMGLPPEDNSNESDFRSRDSSPPAPKAAATPGSRGSASIPSGQELVNMDFPELTDIRDIIKAVSLWTGKNVILDQKIQGRVQIISPKQVTKEEAYQAFLSALNVLDLTTVETGKIIKIVPVNNAMKSNLKTYMGSSWTPRTDEVITQIVPLRYIDAKSLRTTLGRIVTTNTLMAYEPTNTLIITDSGFKVRRILDIIDLLDVQTQQPKVAIVPIKYSDAKSIAEKVNTLYQASSTGAGATSSASRSRYHSYKILSDERTNAVIIFGPPSTISYVRDLVKRFDIEVDDPSRQSSIHVRPLDYADAKKLASTLSSLASAGKRTTPSLRTSPIRPARAGTNQNQSIDTSAADIGENVKITSDESSNSLLITGSRAAYEAINSIVRKLDIRKAQVFVEAEILDVSTDGEFRFGTSIFGGYANADGKGTKYITAWQAEKVGPFITAGAYTDQGNQLSAAEGVAGAFEQDLSIGILSGESITVPGLGSVSPGALIKMLKGDSNTKILSSPHVLTANNEEAEVTVGQKIFFPSSEFNAATQTSSPKVENVDVDLTLSLKPNISFSNYVTLNIQLQANSLSGDSSVPGLPAVTKRMTKQIVTARNGQTIVISGLVQTRDIQAYQKIPFLGDIPILGWLFRNTSVRSAKSNLIIFLTPHVIHGPNDLAAIYKAKVEDQNEFLKSVYGEEGINDDFYKRLPTLSDGSYRADERDSADDQAREALRQQALKDMGYIKDEKEDQKSGSGAKTRDFEISVPAPQGGMAPQDWPSSESLIDEGGMGGMQDQNDSLIDESPPVLNGGDLGDPMPESFDGEGSMGEVL